jgi:predicted transposase/invertase (TIGR01784 family)
MRFVDPKIDIAFRKIFGNEQKTEILISFLNAVLGLEGSKEIEEIELLNPYQVPPLEGLKTSILDVRAKDKRGVTFIVEMQVEKVAGALKRFQYYAAKAYVSQIKSGEAYPKLRPVILIAILDYTAFSDEDESGEKEYLSRHVFLNKRTHKQHLKDLELNFIELPKFTKKEEELTSVLEKWIYFIKHAKDLEVVPQSADIPALKAAYEAANQFGWTSHELEVYDSWSMRTQDERGKLEVARQEAREEGREEGAKQIARNLLRQGLSAKQIAAATGLSVEQIAAFEREES